MYPSFFSEEEGQCIISSPTPIYITDTKISTFVEMTKKMEMTGAVSSSRKRGSLQNDIKNSQFYILHYKFINCQSNLTPNHSLFCKNGGGYNERVSFLLDILMTMKKLWIVFVLSVFVLNVFGYVFPNKVYANGEPTFTKKEKFVLKWSFASLWNTSIVWNPYSDTTNNNNSNMTYIDIDWDIHSYIKADWSLVEDNNSDLTFNSSSADLVYDEPNQTSIKYARLYWYSDEQNRFDTNLERNKILIRKNNGKYQEFISDRETLLSKWEKKDTGEIVMNYSYSADITDFIKQNKNGTYTIANIPFIEWKDGDAGWNMIVVYGNPNLSTKRIDIFDYTSDRGLKENLIVNIPIFPPKVGPVFFETSTYLIDAEYAKTTNYVNIKNRDTNQYDKLYTWNLNSPFQIYGPRNPNYVNNYGTNIIMRKLQDWKDSASNHYVKNDSTDLEMQLISNTSDWIIPINLITSVEEKDSDNDGIWDYDEVNTYHTDPLKPDTDGDGLLDWEEVNTTETNPLKPDTDWDGVNDKKDAFPKDKTEWKDADDDKVWDNSDNCISDVNPNQEDLDWDWKWDVCDDDDDNDGTPDTAELTGQSLIAGKTEIQTQPTDQTVLLGSGVTFDVTATGMKTEVWSGGSPDWSQGTGDELSYQRQVLSGDQRISIPQATGSTFAIPKTTDTMNGKKLRVAVRSHAQNVPVFSDPVTLHILYEGSATATGSQAFFSTTCAVWSEPVSTLYDANETKTATGSTQTEADQKAKALAEQAVADDIKTNGQIFADTYGDCTKKNTPTPAIPELPHTGAEW